MQRRHVASRSLGGMVTTQLSLIRKVFVWGVDFVMVLLGMVDAMGVEEQVLSKESGCAPTEWRLFSSVCRDYLRVSSLDPGFMRHCVLLIRNTTHREGDDSDPRLNVFANC
eukprot:4599851-Amphidinium_carterae.1